MTNVINLRDSEENSPVVGQAALDMAAAEELARAEAEVAAQQGQVLLGSFAKALKKATPTEVLFDPEGAPTELYQGIMAGGQDVVNQLFVGEHWEGADKNELVSALHALPDEVRTEIPNRQTLLANVARQNRVITR